LAALADWLRPPPYQGIQVTVFERNPELREVGAGLTLWANGVQVLRHLGLGDALSAFSARLTSFECWSWRGRRLGSMRLDAIEQRVGAPSLGIHRADLLRLLAGAVDQGSIHVYTHCVGFSSEQEHVIARFADGHEQQTDLLVGADGLYSVIREQLLGKAPPRYSGYTCWRGVAGFEDQHVSPGISSETWGRGRRFGMLPIGNGRVFWYATLNCPAGEHDREGERKKNLLRL
jgi:2-polyprenyl-6-methoxyphenol hydroxylase-like FAD-dependent oxidoreductase